VGGGWGGEQPCVCLVTYQGGDNPSVDCCVQPLGWFPPLLFFSLVHLGVQFLFWRGFFFPPIPLFFPPLSFCFFFFCFLLWDTWLRPSPAQQSVLHPRSHRWTCFPLRPPQLSPITTVPAKKARTGHRDHTSRTGRQPPAPNTFETVRGPHGTQGRGGKHGRLTNPAGGAGQAAGRTAWRPIPPAKDGQVGFRTQFAARVVR